MSRARRTAAAKHPAADVQGPADGGGETSRPSGMIVRPRLGFDAAVRSDQTERLPDGQVERGLQGHDARRNGGQNSFLSSIPLEALRRQTFSRPDQPKIAVGEAVSFHPTGGKSVRVQIGGPEAVGIDAGRDFQA